MAFVKQFLTKTQPSDNTSMFRYSPSLPVGEVEIYSLISISNSVDAETSRFNKFVWDGFLDGFLSKDEDIISRLNNAFLAAEFKLKELIKHDSALEEKGVDLNLSVLVFKQNKVFVGVLGDHKIYLKKKKVSDISELLLKNKSNVGSTLVVPSDILIVSHSKDDLKGSIEGCMEPFEVEDLLEETFSKDGAKGGAFLAMLQEKEKEKPVPAKVGKKKVEKKEEGVDELEKEDIEVGKMEVEVKEGEKKKVELDEKKVKAKAFFANVWSKIKIGFDKVVTFLSEKLSVFWEKLMLRFQNKYGRRRWFKKLQSVTSKKRFSKGVKPFKVDDYKKKELRSKRFVIFFVVLVLLFAVFFGVRATFESRQRAVVLDELEVLLEDWEDSLREIEEKSDEEMDEALEVLGSLSSNIDEYIEGLKEENMFHRLGEENEARIDELRGEIFEIRDEIYKIVPVGKDIGNMELLFDTKVRFGEKSDPVSMAITISETGQDVLYILDAGEKAAYEVSLPDGEERLIDDPDGLLKEPLHIDFGNEEGDDRAVYVYDASSGALRAGVDDDEKVNGFASISGLNPRALGGDVAAFSVFRPNDALNFLVPSQSRIVRSEGFGGTTYNLPSEYISHPSFEEGTEMFGDQYIYVLSTITNGVRRFVPATRLNSQLKISGLVEELRGITTGYTGSTMDRLMVVFDSENERLVQFTKPIEIGENLRHPGEIVMRAQYEYRGDRDDIFKDVRDLVLTGNDSYMYVLDGRRIWKINVEK